MEEEKTFETSDLPLTAFLIMRGLTLIVAKKIGNNKFTFIIKDEDNQAKKLALDYVNSEFCKFDNHIRSIKKLIYTK